MVYDASAKSERSLPSLNDCLYAGPPLSPLIFDIILRFIVYYTALTGDIEKAFLNISDPLILMTGIFCGWTTQPVKIRSS